MATDFFAKQDAARRQTGKLVVLFTLAVLFITLGIYGVFFLAEVILGNTSIEGSSVSYVGSTSAAHAPDFWNGTRFLLTLGVVVIVLGGASLFKAAQYRSGGGVVARSVGGRRVEASTRDPYERRLVNVVEEMAIASGVPVPEIYILENEEGINAFAAGHSPDDAAVAVTRGTLEMLSRDELQGVVAHEFSHILNGDMRLNIKLGAVIFGIFALWIIGQAIVRGAFYSSMGRRNREGGAVGLALVVVGIAFVLLGLLGQLFGRLIQAAISRQREFLADASAVQFTRNPDGIAGALSTIGGAKGKGVVRDASASAVAHAFFCSAYKSNLAGALATHPPLAQRIQAIKPDWDGEFKAPVRQRLNRHSEDQEKTQKRRPKDPGFPFLGRAGGSGMDVGQLAVILGAVGSITPETVRQTREAMSELPSGLREALEDPFGSLAVIACLFLDQDEAAREVQLKVVPQHLEADLIEEVHRLWPHVERLPRTQRLPLLELAANSLRKISESEYHHIMEMLRALADADDHTTLFEFVLLTIVDYRLGRAFRPAAARDARSSSIGPFAPSLSRLYSLLATLDASGETSAETVFDRTKEQIEGGQALEFIPRDKIRMAQLSEDIAHLRTTSFALRKEILKGVLHFVFADKTVTADEAELARAVSIALDCPMPPLQAE